MNVVRVDSRGFTLSTLGAQLCRLIYSLSKNIGDKFFHRRRKNRMCEMTVTKIMCANYSYIPVTELTICCSTNEDGI